MDSCFNASGEKTDDQTTSSKTTSEEQVWTFRGYHLSPGNFTTAMVHYFRAEISRSNVWRQRLDATTNWAVTITGIVFTIAFSDVQIASVAILLALMLITIFLFIEARRYRYYELWSYRVRLMETDFFASMLVPPFRPASDWAESLAENLLQPHFTISLWEALGRRLRRNYIWIYLVTSGAWLLKLWIHPDVATSLREIVQRADLGFVSGEIILVSGLSAILFLIGFSLITINLNHATGEILPRFLGKNHNYPWKSQSEHFDSSPWFRPIRRRQQIVALIITDQSKRVGDGILKEMHRGVTLLNGTGMYTGDSHGVMICALTITEVPHLKALVEMLDSKAFIIISEAKDVLGNGFIPLNHKG